MILTPKIIALDSATLGKISDDYWSEKKDSRARSRKFIDEITHKGVYIALSFTHFVELFSVESNSTARKRFDFLHNLPLIAWVRPYDKAWFPGSIFSIAQREMHSLLHHGNKEWSNIIENVREDLWETGVGSDMFDDFHSNNWQTAIKKARQSGEETEYVRAIAGSQPGRIYNTKIKDISVGTFSQRTDKEEFVEWFTKDLTNQIKTHGDKRIGSPSLLANHFAQGIIKDMQAVESNGGDVIQAMIIDRYKIPPDFFTEETTVGDVGKYCELAAKYKMIGESLKPPAQIVLEDIGLEGLPSISLDLKLNEKQNTARRVSNSDLGDGYIASLVFYADYLEVDKRTFEYLTQISRAFPKYSDWHQRANRTVPYDNIPEMLEKHD